ncbi:hypothetical protein [Epilithonimonas xixisoli]|uniref:Uncharacterized protein n=1 Tax=Epilithonimonas xixisoli TaxID=1476462 RepID=A0A4R8I4U8_9FLAO|nr:hypothetical protein [Epilithonimonas xixisoli]TDX83313.1 hypothetical protein B0I22_3393 [Epilithonimonas xixisoli]
MIKNILRSLSACVAGFVLSFAIFLIFFRYGNQADIMVGYLMFMTYAGFLIYSLIVENTLFFIYQKNHWNAFVTTYSMVFIFILFYFFARQNQESDIMLTVITVPIFLLLQAIGYYFQKRKIVAK